MIVKKHIALCAICCMFALCFVVGMASAAPREVTPPDDEQKESLTRILENLESQLDITPDNGDLWATKANVLFSLQRYDDVLSAIDTIDTLGLNPEGEHDLRSGCYIIRGNTLFMLGKDAEALAAFDKALELNPANEKEILEGKNALLEKLGIPADSDSSSLPDPSLVSRTVTPLTDEQLAYLTEDLAVLEKEINMTPDDPELWSYKANTLFNLHRFDEVLTALDTADTLVPIPVEENVFRAENYVTKGNALFMLGRDAEALAAFDKALELNPTDKLILEGKNELLEKMGKPVQTG